MWYTATQSVRNKFLTTPGKKIIQEVQPSYSTVDSHKVLNITIWKIFLYIIKCQIHRGAYSNYIVLTFRKTSVKNPSKTCEDLILGATFHRHQKICSDVLIGLFFNQWEEDKSLDNLLFFSFVVKSSDVLEQVKNENSIPSEQWVLIPKPAVVLKKQHLWPNCTELFRWCNSIINPA